LSPIGRRDCLHAVDEAVFRHGLNENHVDKGLKFAAHFVRLKLKLLQLVKNAEARLLLLPFARIIDVLAACCRLIRDILARLAALLLSKLFVLLRG